MVKQTPAARTLKSFGCAGDSKSDDAKALRRAAEAGVALDGSGLIYAVAGDVLFSKIPGFSLRNAIIKQLAPNDGARKTFHFSDCAKVKLQNVKFDRNGRGTEGSLDSAAAVWIEGGADHQLTGVEVTGGGKGTGIAVVRASRPRIVWPYCHDMRYDDPSATDDMVQGIWFIFVEDGVVQQPRILRLGGNTRSAVFPAPYRLSRGVVFSGCNRSQTAGGSFQHVDQSIDYTGSDGNFDCMVSRGVHRNIVSNAVKFANSAVRCLADGARIENVGYAGGVISGPAEAGLRYKTEDCVMRNFTVVNPGYNKFDNPNAGAACSIEEGEYDRDYPKGCRFENITGVDNQAKPTMTYVVRSEVRNFDPRTGKRNRAIGIKGSRYRFGLTSFSD